MKTIKFILCLVLCFCFFNCEDDKKQVEAEEKNYQEEKAKAFAEQISLDRNIRVDLQTEAQAATTNWMAYITAKNEIERLDGFTLQEVVNNSNNLLRSVTEMRDSLPESFDVVPVKSRLNVILTKAHLLDQEANYIQPRADEVARLTQELYAEFKNLEIQLNEVFIKSVEDFDMELDKRIAEQDSLARLQQRKQIDSSEKQRRIKKASP